MRFRSYLISAGTDKSFQRGDEDEHGKYYKIVPMYNDKQGNFEGCWTMQGTLNRPVVAQTVVPNMTWFKVSHFYCPAVHGLYAAFHVRKIEFLLRFVEKFSALCFPVLFVFVMFSGLFLR